MPVRNCLALVASLFLSIWIARASAQCSDQLLAPAERTDSAYFGNSIDVDGRWLVIGARRDQSQGSFFGVVRIYRNDGRRWHIHTVLTPPGSFGYFGFSVSIHGNLLAVGAPDDGDGAAYVYELRDDTWVLEQSFESQPNSERVLGLTVALGPSGLWIGAPRETVDQIRGVGAAYFYRRGPNGWLPYERIVPDDPEATDGFARALAFQDDVVVIGAPRSDDGGDAWVYRDTESGWQLEARFHPEELHHNAEFGSQVDIEGGRIAISAFALDVGDERGAVFLFQESAGSWIAETRIVESSSAGVDEFGTSIMLLDDVLYVGSPNSSRGSQTEFGRVTRFEYDGTDWLQTSAVTARDWDPPRERFGSAIGGNEDWLFISARRELGSPEEWPGLVQGYYQSCLPTWTELPAWSSPQSARQLGADVDVSESGAVAGSPYDSQRGSAAGAVRWYERTESDWQLDEEIFASDANANGRFGARVSLSLERLLVAAPGSPSELESRGAAYVFSRSPSGWIEEAKLVSGQPTRDDAYASDVALLPDTAFVGASLDDTAAVDAGLVHVYGRNGTRWQPDTPLMPPSPSPGDLFGFALAADEERLVVGAPLADGQMIDTGAAYVFRRESDGTWSFEQSLHDEEGLSGDRFGAAVALRGRFLAVGASHRGSGVVSLYRRGGGGWQRETLLTLEDGQPGDRFGSAVALGSNLLLAGAPREDLFGADSGGAYVFERSPTGWTRVSTLRPAKPDPGEMLGHSVALWHGDALVAAPLSDRQAFDGGAVLPWSSLRDRVRLIGEPIPDAPVHFETEVLHPSQPGNRAMVLLSRSGREGFYLALDGRQVPLTYDRVTALSLALPVLFTATIDSEGIARTPDVRLPNLPPGLTLQAAALTWDPTTGAWISLTEAIRIVVE